MKHEADGYLTLDPLGAILPSLSLLIHIHIVQIHVKSVYPTIQGRNTGSMGNRGYRVKGPIELYAVPLELDHYQHPLCLILYIQDLQVQVLHLWIHLLLVIHPIPTGTLSKGVQSLTGVMHITLTWSTATIGINP